MALPDDATWQKCKDDTNDNSMHVIMQEKTYKPTLSTIRYDIKFVIIVDKKSNVYML